MIHTLIEIDQQSEWIQRISERSWDQWPIKKKRGASLDYEDSSLITWTLSWVYRWNLNLYRWVQRWSL